MISASCNDDVLLPWTPKQWEQFPKLWAKICLEMKTRMLQKVRIYAVHVPHWRKFLIYSECCSYLLSWITQHVFFQNLIVPPSCFTWWKLWQLVILRSSWEVLPIDDLLPYIQSSLEHLHLSFSGAFSCSASCLAEVMDAAAPCDCRQCLQSLLCLLLRYKIPAGVILAWVWH